MRVKIILILIVSMIISCGDYRKTKNGYYIKGNSKIVFNGIENSLNNKSIISGFVYSKNTKEFIEQAYVQIGTQKVFTDKNGFFNAKVEPGTYSICVNFIGNDEEKIENLTVENNNKIIIIFELGTSVIN